MENFLSGGVAQLQQAKEAVLQANKLQAAYDAAIAEATSKEKDLESQKRYVADKINSAIKERRGQLKKVQDEQVDLANKNLKEVEKKRKAAKTDAVAERITNETSDLTGKNAELNMQAKAMFRENRMPGFCNSKFFYALFAPKKAVDFLLLVAAVIITLGVIPNIVCLLLPTEKLIIKILIYLGIVVFFVAIYFIIFLISKRNTKGDVIEQVRTVRAQIAENNKLIKQRSRTIIKDDDESAYGLEGFDAQIEELRRIADETTQKREEALQHFDKETAAAIREEIQKQHQDAINRMSEELRVSKQMYETAKQKAQAASSEVAHSYEVYLGKKNISADKIDGLITLIQEGKANTIMEALDIQNGEIKQ